MKALRGTVRGSPACSAPRIAAGFAVIAAMALAMAPGCAPPQVSDNEERELGAYEAATIDTSVRVIGDSVVTHYIATLGRSMTSHISRANLDWRYTVVDTSLVNAMALPGGFVYVTTGLIEQSDHMDELACVIAHEIGHVERRHSIKQLQAAGKRDLALLMLCTLTGACRGLGGAIAVQVGADAAAAQYSQHDESEADSMAVVISVRAGIDPDGLPAFLDKVLKQRQEEPTRIDAFFASHPTDEARIAALRRQIAALPAPSKPLTRDSREFHDIQARLRAQSAQPIASGQAGDRR